MAVLSPICIDRLVHIFEKFGFYGVFWGGVAWDNAVVSLNQLLSVQGKFMIRLEEEKWEIYEHAYGVATDIPDLLKMLAEFPEKNDYESEPYFSLWSALCHQGDVYSASYAAVPHIVSLLASNPGKATYDFFLLPVCIEIARIKGNGPVLEGCLKNDYFAALNKMLTVIPEIKNPDFIYTSVLSAAVAACNNEALLAEVILELTPETIQEFWEWFYER